MEKTLKKPIKTYKRVLYPDKDGFIDFRDFEDPKLYPDGIIERFLRNLERPIDIHLHIVRHFHESVNDSQIKKIQEYFSTFSYHWPTELVGNEDRWEMNTEIYHYHGDTMIWDLVTIAIEPDHFFNEYRIVNVQIRDPKKGHVKKTIFKVEK